LFHACHLTSLHRFTSGLGAEREPGFQPTRRYRA
jgi:hypothetical protein